MDSIRGFHEILIIDLQAGRQLYPPNEAGPSSNSSHQNVPSALALTAADLADGVHDTTGISEGNHDDQLLSTAADLADGVHDANRTHEDDGHDSGTLSSSSSSEGDEQQQQEASATEYWAKCWRRRLLGVRRSGLLHKWMRSRDQWTVADEERTRAAALAAFREEMGVFADG
ncbi:MAG: hypothetical protein M1835_007383 [Candelina submexicana]|nr:MAG: hypothetical protein M1835_007383 [Candelina submexicana]